MYFLVVLLTMLVLPAASVVVEHHAAPTIPLILLVGRWFVFWGVGVRLGLAGFRQVLQPRFTARAIFHLESDEAAPVVRELGVANLATGLIGALSLILPSFVLPAAISAGIFYAAAGIIHLGEQERSANENLAMVSDLFMFAVLATFVVFSLPPV